jgi:hypothetical protein
MANFLTVEDSLPRRVGTAGVFNLHASIHALSMRLYVTLSTKVEKSRNLTRWSKGQGQLSSEAALKWASALFRALSSFLAC